MTERSKPDATSSGVGVEPLCCCEYENIRGERSHILACCCDCEAIDEASDACLTCRRINPDTQKQIHDEVSDRCRIPGLGGQGAIKLRLDIVTPVIILPLCICIATFGPIMSVLVLLFMPIFMLFFYKAWRLNFKTRTKFFFVWGVTSCVLMLLVFQGFVIAFREVLLWENLLLTTCGFLMFYFMFKARSNQSCLSLTKKILNIKQSRSHNKKSEDSDVESDQLLNDDNSVKYATSLEEMTAPDIPIEEVPWIDSRPIKDGKIVTWCKDCEIQRPARSGHCNVCETCVSVRDHHCVWIDCCIGATNHRPFIMSMLLFVFCGFYGFHLTMTTVCTPEMYLDYFLLPNDCRFIYGDFPTAVCFVSACYTLMSSFAMLVGLGHQFLLISQNITSQEYHNASRRGFLKWGFYATNNKYNHGVLRNWKDFLLTSRKGHVDLDV